MAETLVERNLAMIDHSTVNARCAESSTNKAEGSLLSECRPGPSSWLISKTSDFWLACAGSGLLLVVMAVVLHWHGDRELDTTDLLLSELHLGATYDSIIRRRLWQRMPINVIAIPVGILLATYVLMFSGQTIVVTTAVLYLAAWHRGRQNFGIARFYQARSGKTVSLLHARLFRTALYLPVVAGVTYFTNTSALYEGDGYMAFRIDPNVLCVLGAAALASVAGYLWFSAHRPQEVHPGERWLIFANAIAFGSAYVLGAWNASFIFVLVVHHEVQYLYFCYSMARRPIQPGLGSLTEECRLIASFMVWPLIGLASWGICQPIQSEWLPPFLTGGLLCHYWLDARIWTSRARRLSFV